MPTLYRFSTTVCSPSRLLRLGCCLLVVWWAFPGYANAGLEIGPPVNTAPEAIPGPRPDFFDYHTDRTSPPEAPVAPPILQHNPTPVIDDARRGIRSAPTPWAFANGIIVLTYDPGSIYHIDTMPGRLTDLQLQPGEALVSVTGADTERWKVEESASGEGTAKRAHILVKPLRAGLTTNMVITTSKRAYHLDVISGDATYLTAISWHYPEDAQRRWDQEERSRKPQDPLASLINHAVIRYTNYTIRTRTILPPSWMPIEVFDDQEKTFIKFPPTLKTGEAPVLYVVSPQGDPQLVNYHPRGDYYIVDRLFDKAELRVGEGKHRVVTIERRRDTAPDDGKTTPFLWETSR
jgi:type IV secretion system protein TrbG